MSIGASAAVTTYTDETSFQTALTGGFTLANLDAAPLNADDSVPAGDPGFLSLGIDVITPTTIADGQAHQIPKPGRDRLIANGTNSPTILNDFAFNFTSPQNGVGALPNVLDGIGDGGHVRIFSGPNLTGALLGVADFGTPTGSFGGIISDELIGSVEITCEFDGDLKCGIYDLQFGTTSVIPLPAALPAMISALLALSMTGRFSPRAR